MTGGVPSPPTLVSAWTAARVRLRDAGVESPAIDARLLVEAAADATRLDILTDPQRPLSSRQVERLEAYVARREKREPVSQILGRKGFWKIMLKVTADVLTPRPESETILDVVLARFSAERRFAMLDLGVGSGALLLAVLTERPLGRGLGVDLSEEALAVARENAANLGLADRVALLRGDWAAGLEEDQFDLVVCNPPYVPKDEIEDLTPEVRDHEPRLALDGGEDGLTPLRRIAPQILRVLRPGGFLAVEIAPSQAAATAALLGAAGAVDIDVAKDLGGRDRVVFGAKKALGNPAAKG